MTDNLGDVPEDQHEALPALYDHCVRVYAAMKAQATDEVIPVTDAPEGTTETLTIYEGHLTQLFAELFLSTPYYTSVKNRLVRMDCIVQLRRGGGSAKSKWVLLREPTEELFNQVELKRPPKGKMAVLEQSMKDLTRLVVDLDAKVEELRNLHMGSHGMAGVSNA